MDAALDKKMSGKMGCHLIAEFHYLISSVLSSKLILRENCGFQINMSTIPPAVKWGFQPFFYKFQATILPG